MVSPWNVLNERVEIFQIVQNAGPWRDGHVERTYLLGSSTFLCCIPLSPIARDRLDEFRSVLLAEPVEQGDTALTTLHPRWSCEQWCMRSLEQLVRQGQVTDQFSTRHPRWKEVFYMDVMKTANRALTNPREGSYNGQVRVVPLVH